uniref:RRM domain-containing protein n=1 Tax=Panagrellus redivivus TaxID=6233 RepID=A0A7E4UWR3_PANRE
MSGTRVYVGHLASRATERDVEDFFRSYGKIRDIVLKSGFGFVEFSDSRDASDAVDDLNGRELCGERVVIQISRRPRESDRYGSDRRGPPGGGPPRRGERYGPPVQTRYRILIENLSTRCSWQVVKTMRIT